MGTASNLLIPTDYFLLLFVKRIHSALAPGVLFSGLCHHGVLEGRRQIDQLITTMIFCCATRCLRDLLLQDNGKKARQATEGSNLPALGSLMVPQPQAYTRGMKNAWVPPSGWGQYTMQMPGTSCRSTCQDPPGEHGEQQGQQQQQQGEEGRSMRAGGHPGNCNQRSHTPNYGCYNLRPNRPLNQVSKQENTVLTV
eukprot:1150712-Pelagomonas_calceolata.AAC.4